jgi:hypothetical protein
MAIIPAPQNTKKPDAMRSQRGMMMELSSLERAFSVANTVYIVAVLVAAGATFFVYFFASKLTTAKDVELRRFQSESARAVAEANARAAEANEKAGQERLARIKIEEKLADRGLTTEQGGNLVRKLTPFAGQAVVVRLVYPEEEVMNIGIQLDAWLRQAGWGTELTREGPGLGDLELKRITVAVRMSADQSTKDAALADERLAVHGPVAVVDSMLPAPVAVLIGRK